MAFRKAYSLSTLLSRSLRRKSDSAAGARAITNRFVSYTSPPIVDSGEDNCIINAYGGSYDRPEQFSIHRGILDDRMVNPFQSSGSIGAFEAKKVENGLFLRMEMPGINKDDVKIWVEYGTIYVKGEGKKEHKNDENGRTYNATIEFTSRCLQPNKIDVELKNGVLRMVIPKAECSQGSDRGSVIAVK